MLAYNKISHSYRDSSRKSSQEGSANESSTGAAYGDGHDAAVNQVLITHDELKRRNIPLVSKLNQQRVKHNLAGQVANHRSSGTLSSSGSHRKMNLAAW